jgi:hypothetical protein
MNTVDKISRDTKILTDSVKDGTCNNLVMAAGRGDLQLSEDQLRLVLNIVNLSVDQYYQKALPTFQNTILKHF